MIVCLTLHPLIEDRYAIPGFISGGQYRDVKSYSYAGGKGINVSRQLKQLGISSTNITFYGGASGKKLLRRLSEEQIECLPVKTVAETRTGISLVDTDQQVVTAIMGVAPRISADEADDFISKAKRVIDNASAVVCCGSSPSHECDSIFAALIEYANSNDKSTFVDTYGTALREAIEAAPFLLHTTVHESMNAGLLASLTEDDIIRYFSFLENKGIKQAYLTNGADPFYCMQFGYLYKVFPPSVRTVSAIGSGDAFVAGLLYGFRNELTFRDTLFAATSLGALNASMVSTCEVSNDLFSSSHFTIHVEPFGSKLLSTV